MKNVAVFFGGKSTEHDISIITAFQTIKMIDKNNYNVIPVFVSKDNVMWVLKDIKNLVYKNFISNKSCLKFFEKATLTYGSPYLYCIKNSRLKRYKYIDVAINCFHGGNGENGAFSGLSQVCSFPIVCGDHLSMGLAMNKLFTKKMCENAKIPVVDYVSISNLEYYNSHSKCIEHILSKFNFPLIVKPSSQGSSIGVSVVNDIEELNNALVLAYEYDNNVLVEKKVEHLKEFNCSVIGSSVLNEVMVSEVEEPILNNSFLSFEDKYIGKNGNIAKEKMKGGMTNLSRKFPAEIDNDLKTKIQEISEKAFVAFNLSGVCRIDFLYNSQTKQLYLNEINTVPGSLSFYFWKQKFGTVEKYYDKLIQTAENEFYAKFIKKSQYFSNILINM